MQSILIVDDDRDICLILSRFLAKNNFTVNSAYTADEGLRLLRQNEYDLVLCDFKLPDFTGIELLQKIKVINIHTAVIIITGYADIKTAVETFKYGANDYITKPLFPDELLASIKEVLVKNETKNQLIEKPINTVEKREGAEIPDSENFIVGESEQSQAVQRYIELIAPSEISVIITGETGTGKEFVAQSIHRLSNRASAVFMAIDCGALPKELAGSELFGHVKGSFTGAIADKAGSFEVANGGTIFLDEIGNLSYENQVKLLRVIQERKIKRIGATKDTRIDVRIISATNENLTQSVKEGTFREDLYHRVNEFKIQILPLRERKEDILFYANFFLQKANRALGRNVVRFSESVKAFFNDYYWYGNLREMNNVIRRAVLLTKGEVLEQESLPVEILHPNQTPESAAMPVENVGKLKSIAWMAERQAIVDMLEKVNYNKSKASQLLQIDRKTLYNKLKLYNIEE
jgi:two-component system, NtrC family, response regulator HydG